MSPKVVLSDFTHKDSHSSFYRGNHRDHYLSLLPFFAPLSFFTVPNTYSWKDPIQNFKAFYSLLRVYETFESTHSLGRIGRTKKIMKRKKSRGGKDTKKRKMCGKIKWKGFMKTYKRKKSILGRAFGTCKGTSELGRLVGSVYVR